MIYDDFFVQGDKPYAENLNDSILCANAFDFNVTVSVPNGFSNNRFVSTTETRKCGVATIRLEDTIPDYITINQNGQLVFQSGYIDLFVYPNFNQFGNWEKISWEASVGNKITVDVLTKDKVNIQSNVPNGGKLNSNVELNKLDEIIVRVHGTSGVVLENLEFLFKKKEQTNVESSTIRLPNYSTTEEMEEAIEEAVSVKADSTTVTEHIENDDIHVTTQEKSTWNNKANASHTHSIANVTNLQTTLNGKQATLNSGVNIKTINNQTLLGSGNITISEDHGVTDYNELENRPQINGTVLSGNKTSANLGLAPASHTHTIANVSNLQTSLDGKAPTSHTHTIANITNLQTTLNGKAGTSHTHTKSQISDFPTTVEMTFTFLDGTVTKYKVYVG